MTSCTPGISSSELLDFSLVAGDADGGTLRPGMSGDGIPAPRFFCKRADLVFVARAA